MDNAQQENSVERRRRLLKGALGASGVMTMGYSGAALASFECVEKVRIDGGYPTADYQFTRTNPGIVANSKGWAWRRVSIGRFKAKNNGGNCPASSNDSFEAFDLDGTLYQVNPPPISVTNPPLTAKGPTLDFCSYIVNGYPQDGWLLVYFDDGGTLTATYPTKSVAEPNFTPATHSCLASVNPGLNTTNITFGG